MLEYSSSTYIYYLPLKLRTSLEISTFGIIVFLVFNIKGLYPRRSNLKLEITSQWKVLIWQINICEIIGDSTAGRDQEGY